jgi:hypothetical protein
MRILHLPMLAAGLGIAGLSIGGLAAYGGLLDSAAAATLVPAAAASDSPVVSSACQELPAAAPSASATASASASASASATAAASPQVPVDLCISVQAGQDSIQTGQSATWTIQVWVQNGPVTGVTVSLTGTLANELPTFTSDCASGNGNTSCAVGDLGTDASPASEQMQAQIAVPSGTAAGTSVALTAIGNATPSLSSVPAASTAVTVEAAPAATTSASPSSSTTPAKSATPSAAASSSSAAKTTAATPAATTAAAALPGVGTLPAAGASLPPTEVSEVTNPGSISSLLPVVTPTATATAPAAGFVTTPAADTQPGPSATPDRASDSSFVLVIPTATAEKIAAVILLLVVAVVLRLRATDKLIPHLFPSRASRGTHTEPTPSRRRKAGAILNLRRRRGDSPKKSP